MHAFQSILLITTDPLHDVKHHFDIDVTVPNIDILILKPEPTIGIESIRNLQSFTSRRPLKSTIKHVIIQESHLLTPEAQNALLKILEEPPDYLRLILTAPHTHTFLETIISRCQLIKANNPAPSAKESPPILKDLLILAPAERLKLIPPDTKVRITATAYCYQLITEAESMLQSKPSLPITHNLQILMDCADQLAANANPTLAISDAVLRLKKIS